jgi:uncharacterized membrane protein YwzB
LKIENFGFKMKQNYKIIFLGYLVFGLMGFGFLNSPIKVFADTPLGGTCSYNTDCGTGLFCDTAHGSTCEGITNTTPCITNDDCQTSKTSFTCISGKCGVPNSTSNPPATQQTTPSPATQTQGTCPTGLYQQQGTNICLPPSEYTTGIAASTSLTGFILTLVKILLSFAGLIAVVMLVLGGYWYMAAGGNEEMSEKGKKTIINFIMGLVVIILAYTIVAIIASTLTGGDKLIQ